MSHHYSQKDPSKGISDGRLVYSENTPHDTSENLNPENDMYNIPVVSGSHLILVENTAEVHQ